MMRTPSSHTRERVLHTPHTRRIAAVFETPRELGQALRQNGTSWDLVLPGHEQELVEVGECARLSLEVRGHRRVELNVMAMWRRIRSGPGLPPALGLRIEPTEASAVARLRGIAAGQFADDVRDVVRWRAATASHGA